MATNGLPGGNGEGGEPTPMFAMSDPVSGAILFSPSSDLYVEFELFPNRCVAVILLSPPNMSINSSFLQLMPIGCR